MRELFDNDPTRGKHLTAEGAGIYVDYSKNRVTEETLKLKLVCLYEHGVFTQGVIWTINPFDQSQSLGAICHW